MTRPKWPVTLLALSALALVFGAAAYAGDEPETPDEPRTEEKKKEKKTRKKIEKKITDDEPETPDEPGTGKKKTRKKTADDEPETPDEPGTEEKKKEKKTGKKGAAAKGVGAKPVVVKGEVSEDDPKDEKLEQPCKLHTVGLKKGKVYVVELMSASPGFDPHLRIEDPEGEEVGDDDDGGEKLNSRIFFAPKADGDYKIVAASHNGQAGKYLLRVSEFGNPAKAHTIDEDGLKIEGKLTQKDERSLFPPNNPAKIYSVKLKAGETYVIDLESDEFDSVLRVLDPGFKTVGLNDDIAPPALHAQVTLRPQDDGTYYIIANSLDERLGAFTFRISKKE